MSHEIQQNNLINNFFTKIFAVAELASMSSLVWQFYFLRHHRVRLAASMLDIPRWDTKSSYDHG